MIETGHTDPYVDRSIKATPNHFLFILDRGIRTEPAALLWQRKHSSSTVIDCEF